MWVELNIQRIEKASFSISFLSISQKKNKPTPHLGKETNELVEGFYDHLKNS